MTLAEFVVFSFLMGTIAGNVLPSVLSVCSLLQAGLHSRPGLLCASEVQESCSAVSVCCEVRFSEHKLRRKQVLLAWKNKSSELTLFICRPENWSKTRQEEIRDKEKTETDQTYKERVAKQALSIEKFLNRDFTKPKIYPGMAWLWKIEKLNLPIAHIRSLCLVHIFLAFLSSIILYLLCICNIIRR